MTNDPKEKPARKGFHIPEPVRDTLLFVGQWLIVTIGIFAWWMGLLLVVSLFAVNVWHITFHQIVIISVIATAVCSAGYLVIMLRRDGKKEARTRRDEEGKE